MRKTLLSLLVAFSSIQAIAQNSGPQLKRLVVWSTSGSLALPTGTGWKFEKLSAYDQANRVVALYKSADEVINASWVIFPNLSGTPSSEGCRSDVINPLLKQFKSTMSHHTDATFTSADGHLYPSTSYDLAFDSNRGTLHNIFIFAGDAHTCAELHVSTTKSDLAAAASVKSTLNLFAPDLAYQPTAADLSIFGTLLFHTDPESAAPFYGVGLQRLADTPDVLPARRFMTDQLVIALGMSGHPDGARHYAEAAIPNDPDYPINYYNLACADAEEGKEQAARTHLEQAFARRQNVLPGETMPDPTKDSSFLKLQKNKAFWDYVLTLAPSTKL